MILLSIILGLILIGLIYLLILHFKSSPSHGSHPPLLNYNRKTRENPSPDEARSSRRKPSHSTEDKIPSGTSMTVPRKKLLSTQPSANVPPPPVNVPPTPANVPRLNLPPANVPPPPANVPPSNFQGLFNKQNCMRKNAGLEALVWDDVLAQRAKDWAIHLQQNEYCTMRHPISSEAECQQYLGGTCNTGDGQNLARWGSSNPDQTNDQPLMFPQKTYSNAGDMSIEGWYAECKDYKDLGWSEYPDTGHYTQVLWKDTKRVGCAQSECHGLCKGGDPRERSCGLVVCNYSPSGNINPTPGMGFSPYDVPTDAPCPTNCK